jgi:hypothetical protein
MKKRKTIVAGKNINGEKKKKHSAGPIIHAYRRTLIEVVCVEMITSSLTFSSQILSLCGEDDARLLSHALFDVRPWNTRRKEHIKKRQIDREGRHTVPPTTACSIIALNTTHGMHVEKEKHYSHHQSTISLFS